MSHPKATYLFTSRKLHHILVSWWEYGSQPVPGHCEERSWDLRNFEVSLHPGITGRHLKTHQGARTQLPRLKNKAQTACQVEQEAVCFLLLTIVSWGVHPQPCLHDGSVWSDMTSHCEARTLHSLLPIIYSSGQDVR